MTGKIEYIMYKHESFKTEYGTLYTYEVSIDGKIGAYYAKSPETKYKAGDTVEYEFIENPKGNKIKIKGYPQGIKKKGGNGSFALSYAKDLAIAHIEKGNDFGAKEILQVADVFKKWLDENE